jgi:hypothetical protein
LRIKKPNFEEKEKMEEDWNAKTMPTLQVELEGMKFCLDSFEHNANIL